VNIIHVEPGRLVLCDWCDQDFTESQQTGGFMFSNYATGPCCAARIERNATRSGEAHLIRSRCPDGVPFGDWVRSLRDPASPPPPNAVVMSIEEVRAFLTKEVPSGRTSEGGGGTVNDPLFRCPRCSTAAPWTDGRTREAGSDIDEFWCQTCGAETPLDDMEKVTK